VQKHQTPARLPERDLSAQHEVSNCARRSADLPNQAQADDGLALAA
jgi:hypothetical protein